MACFRVARVCQRELGFLVTYINIADVMGVSEVPLCPSLNSKNSKCNPEFYSRFLMILLPSRILVLVMPSVYPVYFYRAMHFSAKRGIAIACRLSVRPSVRL